MSARGYILRQLVQDEDASRSAIRVPGSLWGMPCVLAIYGVLSVLAGVHDATLVVVLALLHSAGTNGKGYLGLYAK